MRPASFSPQRHRSALTLLMARYVVGEIADQAWGRISEMLDAEDLLPEERLTLAVYLNQRLEKGEALPKAEEVGRLLATQRAA